MITYEQLETLVLHLLDCEKTPEIEYRYVGKGRGRKKEPYIPPKFIKVRFYSGTEGQRGCVIEIFINEDELTDSLIKLKRAYYLMTKNEDLFSFKFGWNKEVIIAGQSFSTNIKLEKC